jgi:hypothetical protein
VASASLTAYLCACGSPSGNSPKTGNETHGPKAADSGWIESVTTSGIDGRVINRAKVFKVAGDGARIRVILTCLVSSKHLTLNIESYASDGERPSPFVSQRRLEYVNLIDHPDRVDRPVGRIKFAAADATDLAEFFAEDKYSNVILWDLSEEAERFLANTYGDRRRAAETIVANQFPVNTYEGSMTVGQWNEDQDRRMPEQKETASKAYASGNYLQSILPIFIEASNGQGTFEVQIPNDDPGVNDLLRSCASSGLTSAQLASIFVFDPPKGSPTHRTPNAESSVAQVSSTVGATTPSQSTAEMAPTSPAAQQVSITPSFDCSKASTIVEKLICSTPQLASADSEMATEYSRRYSAAGPNAAAVRQAQRQFIAIRNQCSTTDCIAQAYRARRAELAQLTP